MSTSYRAVSWRVGAMLAALLLGLPGGSRSQQSHSLSVRGTEFLLDGEPFPYTGVSFFNAIYNPTFNQSSEERQRWLDRLGRYGINVLRVWGQWDNERGFVDTCDACTLYHPDGSLRREPMERLVAIVRDADRKRMVVQLALFSRESWNEGIRLDSLAARRAVMEVARELLPYRNVVLQVWNEHSDRVLEHAAAVREVDPGRLVTNSPGYAGDLGSHAQNRALDFLTPHTTRDGRYWEVAPREVALLLAKFDKPVVDDEPARTGTRDFGGPRGANYAYDHILRIQGVWRAGGYVTYHHDMFQTGYGTPAIPPSGIPDPEFSPYHRIVFDFLALRDRYMPAAARAGSTDGGR